MVKKLLRHEFIYYFRTFSLFLPMVLIIALVTRIFKAMGNERYVQIVQGSSEVLLTLGCVALLVMSVAVGVIRFYKNMYSAEGYLTLTLPVTHTAHIFVKLLAAIICQVGCAATVFVASIISKTGEELSYMWSELDFTISRNAMSDMIFVVEIIALILTVAISNMLMYYTCITIGQTAKKNRILMSVGAYFLIYIISQVVATIAIIVISVLSTAGALDGIAIFFSRYPELTIQLFLLAFILMYVVISAIFWRITQSIMTKKLNLE